jgi:glycosyltransferase involved in cell wall biosynthesis
MRIAYDITQTGADKAGCGYFAYSLIRALAAIDQQNEYLLLNSFGEQNWDGEASPVSCGIHQNNFKLGLSHANHVVAYRFWHSPPFDLEKALGEPDIVHANNFYCPTGLLHAYLIYTLYDLSFIDHPEWTTEANRSFCFDGVYKASLYANAILAISEHSRSHFLSTFPHYPAEKVHVIYPASRYTRHETINKPNRLSGRVQKDQFWLCVGTLEPRKNHLGLLRAYARHKARSGKVLPLVHAGGPGWLMDDFKDQIRKLKLDDDVILLGYVDNTTLQWLYQNCFAFIYPSFFEGFGMPVLEAMSQGAAVIASNITSIPEIVGNAGILVSPVLDEQLANAMDELAEDEKRLETLKLAALAQAARFSWNRSAQETLKLYQ